MQFQEELLDHPDIPRPGIGIREVTEPHHQRTARMNRPLGQVAAQPAIQHGLADTFFGIQHTHARAKMGRNPAKSTSHNVRKARTKRQKPSRVPQNRRSGTSCVQPSAPNETPETDSGESRQACSGQPMGKHREPAYSHPMRTQRTLLVPLRIKFVRICRKADMDEACSVAGG
jgi:hypothetical protein